MKSSRVKIKQQSTLLKSSLIKSSLIKSSLANSIKKQHIGFCIATCLAFSCPPNRLMATAAPELFVTSSSESSSENVSESVHENTFDFPHSIAEDSLLEAELLEADPETSTTPSSHLDAAPSMAETTPSTDVDSMPSDLASSYSSDSESNSESTSGSTLWQDILLAIAAAGVATMAMLLISWSNHPSSHPYNPAPA